MVVLRQQRQDISNHHQARRLPGPAIGRVQDLSSEKVSTETVLAVGDGLSTDICGEVRQDIDVLFVTAA
ncbi:hypothetical protein [Roseibium sp. Sym1]|uniref:hypothetical protein n=1 Tax=Roseibium sp. Sym1 TaxID=3016006 RepID=UPI0022B4366D|nr:hypothetical protein [Roseibium sp. Sym1]